MFHIILLAKAAAKEIKRERTASKGKGDSKKSALSKTDLQAFSGQWKVLGKDVIRNSQGG